MSAHRVSRILAGYFGGIPQRKIAKRAGVDQATVSVYNSRFKRRVSEVGLWSAGKEFDVFDEVDGLRSLSVELSKAKLTVAEAKDGLRIFRLFIELGVSPKEHGTLLKACKQLKDLGFVHGAVKLVKIEQESHIPYEQAISGFEKATSQLLLVEKQLKEVKAQVESVRKSLAQEKQALAGVKAQLAQLQKEAKAKEAKLEHQLEGKMKKLGVQHKEVEEIAKLKTELAKEGLDIPILIKLAKEVTP